MTENRQREQGKEFCYLVGLVKLEIAFADQSKPQESHKEVVIKDYCVKMPFWRSITNTWEADEWNVVTDEVNKNRMIVQTIYYILYTVQEKNRTVWTRQIFNILFLTGKCAKMKELEEHTTWAWLSCTALLFTLNVQVTKILKYSGRLIGMGVMPVTVLSRFSEEKYIGCWNVYCGFPSFFNSTFN